MNAPWDTFEQVIPVVRSDNAERPTTQAQPPTLIILGAGLAGCWLARTLAERGISVCLVDQHSSIACGASGNPGGIVKPFVTRAPCHPMQFYSLAHAYLLERLNTLTLTAAGFQPCGVVQLVHRAYPASELYHCLDSAETKLQIGHNSHSPSIYFPDSGWLNPQTLCQSLVDHPSIHLHLNHKVNACTRSNDSDKAQVWTLQFTNKHQLACTHLVLASGDSLSMLPETQHLPIVPARGQLSRFEIDSHTVAPRCVVSGKHYIIPDGKTILVGASFERGITHNSVLQSDHDKNRMGLSSLLPDLSINPVALGGYAGVRATTPDRMPLIGPMPDVDQCNQVYAQLHHGNPHRQYSLLPTIKGLYVLGGFGSRGIVTAPLGAKLLADYLTGMDTMESWASLVNPARFLIKQIKRGAVT